MKTFKLEIPYNSDTIDSFVQSVLVYWLDILTEEIYDLKGKSSLMQHEIEDLQDALKYRDAVVTTLQYCTEPDRFVDIMEGFAEENW